MCHLQVKTMTTVPLPLSAACTLLCAITLSGCTLPGEGADSETLANLRFSPGAFDSFRRNTEILYTLRQPARISFSIVQRADSGAERPVNTIFTEILESKGYHSHTWLGDTFSGLFAPAGDYIGVLRVDGRRFEAPVRVFHF